VRRKLSALESLSKDSLVTPLFEVEEHYRQNLAKYDSKANQKRERTIERLIAQEGDTHGPALRPGA
jgi:hypothetical protein